MIKRQFYKQDHDNDKDDISDSSSDSESEEEVSEAQEEEEQEEDEDSDVAQAKEDVQPFSLSTGSGYNSEESSADEVDFDSPGSLLDDAEEEEIGKDTIKDSRPMSKRKFESVKNANSASKDPIDAVFAMRTLKFRSVFKCRLCPRIVCLSEETMKAHLTSKRHARSEKLLAEGRLKFMLNSDGEAEEEPETHAERHARTLAIAQDLTGKGSCPSSKKKNRGRQRQRNRKRKETGDVPDKQKKKKSVKKQDKEKEKQSVKKQDIETKHSVKKQDKEIEKQSVKTQAKKRRKNKD